MGVRVTGRTTARHPDTTSAASTHPVTHHPLYAIASSSSDAVRRDGVTGASRSKAVGSSSAATRFWRSRPQPLQRWTTICSPSDRNATPTAAISARQGLARSPGRRRSTCRDVRHTGQWLRCRPPETVGPTKVRQRPHLNGSRSLRRVRRRKGTSSRARRGRDRGWRTSGSLRIGGSESSSSRCANSSGVRRGMIVSSNRC
jgi:hypothetical protein